MSTSLLYHGFGIRGYRYVRTEYIGGEVVFTIVQDPKTYRCPACGGRNIILKGGVTRRFRGLPIGGRKVAIVFRVPRIRCYDCNVVRQTALGFADPRRTYTRSFAQYVLHLARLMTIQDVALHLGISWDVVKEIVKNDLQRRFSNPKLKDLRQIAIDEISIGKGHRYLTIVLDLETGVVVHVGHGKGGDALLDFWEQDSQEEAEAFLLDWILRAESTGIRILHQFSRTLRFHAHGLLAYYDYAISTGPLEGINNKIKTMKRQAYGFRDNHFFMLKIYALHESRYALVG